ncbi:MAG: Asp-tRNA(Asn)/Glu-tRNA(Gln) amidotransferase subunit GatB [Candidatus Falkowbacteria bacterium]
MKLETIIGLEFHVQLRTKSKMFCCCSNCHPEPARLGEASRRSQVEGPNKNICPICMGHPGTLPVLNSDAVNKAITAGLALNCEIAKKTKFDRKNYFYPDLPKGFQISQYDLPIAEHGWFIINAKAEDGLAGSLTDENETKRIGITRVHMEEDTAKIIHSKEKSLLDFNRAGVPLIEVVTEPSFSTPNEAKTFAQELQLLMRHLDISDADMEKGHLRCDANISVRPVGDNDYYTKVEIKNLNSFKSIEKALAFEEKRLTVLWHDNKYPETKETRGWDDKKQETILQRTKEDVADYRFFPEPDIPPLEISTEQIEQVKNKMHELPQEKRLRFVDELGFNYEQAKILTAEKQISFYIEEIISELAEWLTSLPGVADDLPLSGDELNVEKNKRKLNQLIANWFINKLAPKLTEQQINGQMFIISAENFAEFISLIFTNKINRQIADKVFEIMLTNGQDPSQILEENDFKAASANEVDSIIKQVLKNNPKEVVAYKQGKVALLQFFVGQAMKETKGQADANELRKLFENFLK